LARTLPDVHVEILESAAAVTNTFMLQRGEVDAAFSFADVAYVASVGQLPGMSAPLEIRAIAGLPTGALQVLVGARSTIRSIADLRGRRISLGPPGTGAGLTAELALSAFGLALDDVLAERLPYAEGARRVSAGTLDAAFWAGAPPNDNIAGATRQGARLLQVAGAPIERLRFGYPFFKPSEIPPGTYPNIQYRVHTIGVDGIFIVRAELDEQLVYRLTHAFFETVRLIWKEVPALYGLNISRASSTPIPLHPGAARYYREQELRR
jgi:TRAP transporter TAXI family solute receptor